MTTRLLYLENMQELTCNAVVTDIVHENDKTVLILDQTIFYPQGGGQPYDTGTIWNASGKFLVTEVRFVDGIVKHIGSFEHGDFTIGQSVKCIVDQERRLLHSRLHSAGHVVDMAVAQLNLDWVPGKGFHFPEGPYVEYQGSLEGVDKEQLQKDMERICKEIIAQNAPTTLMFIEKEAMSSVCRNVPSNLPENKPARVVLYGSFGVPCGGTHVAQTGDIQNMNIRKIKLEKGAIRIAYNVTS